MQNSAASFTALTKLVEEVTEKLMKDGFSVTRYHAGLSDSEKSRIRKILSSTAPRSW